MTTIAAFDGNGQPPSEQVDLDASRRAHDTEALAVVRRVDKLVRDNYGFVWRTARRMGLAAADAEDVAQRVMIATAKRIDDVAPGKEKAFLFRVTYHVAARAQRAARRRPEDATEDVAENRAPESEPETLLARRRALQQFESIVSGLPEKLRTPLLLFEVEGFTKPEIAEALRIRLGTVSSRIRRARELFLREMSRRQLARREVP